MFTVPLSEIMFTVPLSEQFLQFSLMEEYCPLLFTLSTLDTRHDMRPLMLFINLINVSFHIQMLILIDINIYMLTYKCCRLMLLLMYMLTLYIIV